MYSIINKILLLSLFILCYSTGAFATEFVDEVSIFVYGDASYMEVCFNTLAMIFVSDAFKDMTYVASGIFLAYAGFEIYKNQSLDFVIKQGALYATIGILVLNTNAVVTVKVFDKRSDHGMMNYVDFNGNPIPTFAPISNVPYIIGLFAGSASYLRYALVEISDTTFSTIQDQDTSYTKIGFMQNFITMKNLIGKANFDHSEKLQDFDKKISAYIAKCILEQIAPANPSIVDNMKNPKNGDLLSFIDPTNVGIDSSMTISYGTLGTMSCESFYTSQIAAKAKDASDELFATLEAMEKPVSVSSISNSLADTFKTKTTSTVLAGVSDLQAYITNIATSTSSLTKALNSHQIGVDMSTTANSNLVASRTATASLQLSGVGQFEWVATILPHAIYFMMGIIYVVGIFPLLFVLAFRQFGLILSYGKSILTLELISYSLSVVHNATTYFSQHDAANKLAFLVNKGNAGSASNLPMHLDYLATMTGTAGIIGVTVALALPGLIMKGEISGMLGALGSFGGRYNNSPEAISAMLEQILQKQMTNDQQRRDGADESSLGEQLQAQKIKAGMDRSAQTYAAIHAASNQSDYLRGASRSSVNQASSTIGLGSSGVTNSDAISSGLVTGTQQGISMQETAKMDGNKNFFEGVRGQVAKGLGATEGMGREMAKEGLTSESLKQIGRSQGAKTLAGENAALNADTATGLTEGDGTVSETARRGMFRNSRVMSEKTMGAGTGHDQSEKEWSNIRTQANGQYQSQFADAKGFVKSGAVNNDGDLDKNYSTGIQNQADIKASQTMGQGTNGDLTSKERNLMSKQASGQFQEQFSSAEGYIDEAMNGNKLKGNYAKGVRTSSAAKVAGISGVGDLDDGATKDYIRSNETQSTIKANELIGATEGKLNALNKGKKPLETSMGAAQRSARLTEEAKTSGTLESINAVGNKAFVENQVTKAVADTVSLNKGIETANSYGSKYEKGYVGLQEDSSMLRTQQMVGSTEGIMDIYKHPEKLQNFVDKSLDAAQKSGKGKEVKDAFSKSGLIDSNGKVMSENWAKAKAFLTANNMNSHNALVAGGMVFSGALGENSSVQATSLDSLTKGNKQDTYDNADSVTKGKSLNYDAIIDMLGNGTAGEIVKGILGGAGILGAADALTGGGVRKGVKGAFKKGTDSYHNRKGHVQGSGGEWYDPNKRGKGGVDEYLDKNKGSKDYLDPSSAPKPSAPSTNATAHATPNNTTAHTSAVNMDTSLNNLHNSSTNPTHIQGENPLAPHASGGWKSTVFKWATGVVGLSVTANASEYAEKAINAVEVATGFLGQIINPQELGRGSDDIMFHGNSNTLQSSPSSGSISPAPFSNINQDKLKQELAQANLENGMKEAENIARDSANSLNDVLTQQDAIQSELEKVKKNSKPRVVLKD